jgi:alkaline phosphatase
LRKASRLYRLIIASALLFVLSCTPQEADRPANIILLIGDGMGAAHITYGDVMTGCLQAERMPVGGLIKTYPHGGLITDSAASGTAMSTGHKTLNGMISISPEGDTLKTLFEFAEENGMSTGLVATSSITHATPAVFAAHVNDRGMQAEIARQMAEGGVDLIIGGGWAYFVPLGVAGSKREDRLDLIAVLKERMPVVRSLEALMGLEETSAAAAFLAPRECPPAKERHYTLAQLTSRAIEILSSGDGGFVLMVEGSQIDWAGHDRDGEGILAEMVDFDGAVGAALDFAEKDGSTLVIMTSDHETGGMSVNGAGGYSSNGARAAFTTGDHTMELVPLTAFGPGAEPFGGIHDNTFIGIKLIEYVKK